MRRASCECFVTACQPPCLVRHHYLSDIHRARPVGCDDYHLPFVERIQMLTIMRSLLASSELVKLRREDVVGVLVHGPRYEDALFSALAQAHAVASILVLYFKGLVPLHNRGCRGYLCPSAAATVYLLSSTVMSRAIDSRRSHDHHHHATCLRHHFLLSVLTSDPLY